MKNRDHSILETLDKVDEIKIEFVDDYSLRDYINLMVSGHVEIKGGYFVKSDNWRRLAPTPPVRVRDVHDDNFNFDEED